MAFSVSNWYEYLTSWKETQNKYPFHQAIPLFLWMRGTAPALQIDVRHHYQYAHELLEAYREELRQQGENPCTAHDIYYGISEQLISRAALIFCLRAIGTKLNVGTELT